ncbi:TPA: hypothetical protein ACG3OA_002936 [Legionella pneumophila]|uniref:hypothetical protein n=1 Tax=Legionella pneumophila TaxID=446 RepID=UPI000D05AF20|nr:hypothetical protein [Legionella pneumophila]MCH9115343.1 hypothetical protein [Legionella pneumophila serogroup 1]HAT1821687.1 hypothetical protein [Legionella pneumophila]HAU1134360.1 hypothetical protein [Legionella pneumophila]HAU1180808.1 hypothetical protein [Legionella pneumophila]HAU1598966.1 hypothetical protein [Legionella pneumophila]
MRQKREFNSLRPYLLSILFLFYYGGIAIICWALWCVLNGFDIKDLVETKAFMFIVCTGLASGAILFGTALPKVEQVIKWYWNQGSGKGMLKAMLYLVAQLLLFCLPVELGRQGYWLIQQLTPSIFILGLGVTLIGVTYSRYQGITCPGLSICAQ